MRSDLGLKVVIFPGSLEFQILLDLAQRFWWSHQCEPWSSIFPLTLVRASQQGTASSSAGTFWPPFGLLVSSMKVTFTFRTGAVGSSHKAADPHSACPVRFPPTRTVHCAVCRECLQTESPRSPPNVNRLCICPESWRHTAATPKRFWQLTARNSLTPAECPTIQFSFDTISLELTAAPPG